MWPEMAPDPKRLSDLQSIGYWLLVRLILLWFPGELQLKQLRAKFSTRWCCSVSSDLSITRLPGDTHTHTHAPEESRGVIGYPPPSFFFNKQTFYQTRRQKKKTAGKVFPIIALQNKRWTCNKCRKYRTCEVGLICDLWYWYLSVRVSGVTFTCVCPWTVELWQTVDMWWRLVLRSRWKLSAFIVKSCPSVPGVLVLKRQ